MQLKWINAEKTILQAQREDGSYLIVEPGHPKWGELSKAKGIKSYKAPPPPSMEDKRAKMACSPAQMRLALHRADLLKQVQAIADADTEASIVWEYATQIVRNSPLIDALGGENGFTDGQIDDIFEAAMAVEV